jgi:hypothetical protein
MVGEDVVSRGEFELLRQMVTQNQRRLEGIDQGGTKGVAVVQTQLIEVIKDLSTLAAEVDKRFDAHAHLHEQETSERVASRRWAIGTFLTVIAILVTLVAQILGKLH